MSFGGFKQLDSYSLLIVSKYFKEEKDYINVMCVCKKFQETTEKLRFNPISISSLKLFPKIQTQYLYSNDDTKIDGIDNYEIWYKVDFKEYKRSPSNVKFHFIRYSKFNRFLNGNNVPKVITKINKKCFEGSEIQTITLPNSITSIGNDCFSRCTNLKIVVLPNRLIRINDNCFSNCFSLTSIVFPSSINSIGNSSFSYCSKLQSIDIPYYITSIGRESFHYCSALQSIKLPPLLTILQSNTFNNCVSLTSVELPISLIVIDALCFYKCVNLKNITLPISLKTIGNKSIGVNCFKNCTSLTNFKLESKSKDIKFKVSYNDLLFYNKFDLNCPYILFTQTDVKSQISDMRNQKNILNDFVIPDGVVEIDNFFFF
ncbi:hypothetical protein QTN25_008108 [Entamoeba marina]